MRELKRPLFIASRWVAFALGAALLLETFRSHYHTDTLAVMPLAFVTHRGALYIAPAAGFDLETEPVFPGRLPWPLLGLPLGAWRASQFAGFGWFDEAGTFVMKMPMAAPLAFLAAYLFWWHRARPDFATRRTYYLACPSCGYLLCEVHATRCPECGIPIFSRVVEALPPKPPRTRRHDTRRATRP